MRDLIPQPDVGYGEQVDVRRVGGLELRDAGGLPFRLARSMARCSPQRRGIIADRARGLLGVADRARGLLGVLSPAQLMSPLAREFAELVDAQKEGHS